ncbi:ABC transporter ATP-binding protein [soil metagenome]
MIVERVSKTYRATPQRSVRRLSHLGAVFTRRRVPALQDVSFEVASGEVFGLMGSNGSGKSTLLRLLAGLTRPSTGTVTLNGKVNGMLALGDSLHAELSGEENAYTTALLAGLTPRAARRKLSWIAEFAELEHVMDQPLRTYSEGMRLRLAFAASVAIEPEILLIDELLAVGDSRFQERCIRHMEQMTADGVTIIVTSHSLAELERLCSRAMWLRDGVVVALGEIESVAERYANAMNDAVAPATATEGGGLRMGSGEAEIRGVRLTSPLGVDLGDLRSGDPCVVEVEIGRSDVPFGILGVAISLDDGTTVLDLTVGSEVGVPLREGDRHALEVDRIDLGGGVYHLDVGLYAPNWTHPIDYQWHVLEFRINGEESTGKLAPPHRWRHR